MQIASKGLMWNASFAGNGKTVLVPRADAGRMTVRLSSGSLAPGSTNVTIDWGDGTVDVLPRISGTTHTYRSERLYMVKISDDLQSFGYAYGNPSRTDFTRDMLVELKSLGSKVTRIEGYCFNNCHNMTGVMYLPNVTQIGGYAFGTTLGITDFILPSMTRLVQESFYAGPSPTQLHADKVQQIDSRFWEYYGGHLTDRRAARIFCFLGACDWKHTPISFKEEGLRIRDNKIFLKAFFRAFARGTWPRCKRETEGDA